MIILAAQALWSGEIEDRVAASCWGGWGDGGTISVEEFDGRRCIHLTWQDAPVSEMSFWALSRGVDARDLAGLSYDLYVKSLEPGSSVGVFVSEKDGDRWLRVHGDDTSKGEWLKLDLPLDKLSFWGLGPNTPDPSEIVSVHLEPSGKACEIYLADVTLRQADGKEIRLLDPDSIPLNYQKPLRRRLPNALPFENRAFIAADPRSWGNGSDTSLVRALAKLFPRAGISSGGTVTDETGALSDSLRRLGIPFMAETQDAHDFGAELTLRQAWGVRFDGASNNLTPGAYDTGHTACLNHPEYLAMQKRRVKAAAEAGVKALVWIDYITPYFGGRWGYAEADTAAYRRALAEKDGGLDIIADGKKKNISFWDYYEDYTGFRPSPEDAGFGSWEEYAPPAEPERVFEMGDRERLRHSLFLTLCHYAWLKLLNDTGSYYASLNGGRLWLIPNPEDVYDGADYIYACRLAGVGGILCEYFGNPGFLDAAYHSGPYLRRNSGEGGALEGPVLETNAGGHGLPYYDPWVSYITAWDLYAAMQANVTKNDFLEGDSIEPMLDPANAYAYARFADMAVKQYAFEDYLRDKPVRPAAKTAVIGGRNINRLRPSLFHSLDSREGSPAAVLHSLGYAYDLLDESVFAPWDDYAVMFAGVWDMNRQAGRRLAEWVKKGNTLVLSGAQPYAVADGVHFSPFVAADNHRVDDMSLGQRFGIGPFKARAPGSGTVTLSRGAFREAIPAGSRLFAVPDTVMAVEGDVLLEADGIPLVTQRALGKGRVIYIGYKAGEPANADLDRQVFYALARELGAEHRCITDGASCHVYGIGGGMAAALWNSDRLANYEFIYDSNRSQQLTIDSPSSCSARVFVPDGEYLIYYVHAGKTEKARGSSVLLQTSDTCELCYILPDTPESEALIEAMRRSPLRTVAEGRSKISLPE
ncbi:MAG: hypothetical protein IK083_00285 [Abditibacteriota bacterium]|nr:hypothetical protein [Abditibacteriota bacterium]